jgi:hypothetical protein
MGIEANLYSLLQQHIGMHLHHLSLIITLLILSDQSWLCLPHGSQCIDIIDIDIVLIVRYDRSGSVGKRVEWLTDISASLNLDKRELELSI